MHNRNFLTGLENLLISLEDSSISHSPLFLIHFLIWKVKIPPNDLISLEVVQTTKVPVDIIEVNSGLYA